MWKTDVHSAGPAFVLSQLDTAPDMPRPIGIFRDIQAPTYESDMHVQIERAVAKKGAGSLESLINSGDTWTV